MKKYGKLKQKKKGINVYFLLVGRQKLIKSGNPIIIPVHVEKDKVYTLKCKNKATKHFNDFYFMDDLLNGKVKSFRRSVGKNTTLNSFVDTIITFTADRDYKYLQIDTGNSDANGYIVKNTLQLEEGSIATPYEPYKTNILSTPEEVVLCEVNGVKDTLNLNTGEYIQRIGEVVLDGGNNYTWSIHTNSANTIRFQSRNIPIPAQTNQHILPNVLCDKLKVVENINWQRDEEQMDIGKNAGNYEVNVRIAKTKLSGETVEALKNYLQANPITVQYELATPIIKTVDLSSSGNWEKVVYSGASNESWSYRQEYDTTNTYCFKNNRTLTNALLVNQTCPSFSDNLPINGLNVDKHSLHINGQPNVIMKIDKKLINEPTDINLRQYLQQNPITVWYQTSTTADSTQVKQPIFFEDGHIQLSSGAENSLIPTLDYQAKTSNSYVMDLMKANTRYTMKAKSASGNFTLGGSSYSLGTNRVFSTTGAEFNANNMMVITGSYEDLMILEGELTSKTIPYFKGIKSAFEGESKIEVLSTSQNILDTSKIVQGDLLGGGIIGETGGSADNWCYTVDYIPCPSIKQKLYAYRTVDGQYSSDMTFIYFFNDSKELLGSRIQDTVFKIPVGAKYMRIMVYKGDIDISRVGIMVTNSGTDRFDQSVGGLQNSTKIPLLSPLRSLPNGVCDELIVDRMKKKATLIQRIKSTVFNGSEGWNLNGYSHDKLVEFVCHSGVQMAHTVFSDRFITGGENVERVAFSGGSIYIRILKTKVSNVDSFKKWLSQNPLTVQYGLQTPLITEIDLESFPLVYKDGHIFLNSEIAPVVEIDYNVNQAQQIQIKDIQLL